MRIPPKVFLTMTLLTLFLTAIVFYVSLPTNWLQIVLQPRMILSQYLPFLDLDRQHIVGQLLDIRSQLHRAIMRNTAPTHRVLEQVDQLVDLFQPQVNVYGSPTNTDEVCPEVYHDPFKGWVMENCTYSKPLPELIEVALYYPNCNESRLALVLQGIRKVHPTMTVRIAVNYFEYSICQGSVSPFTNVKIVIALEKEPGSIWNQLVSHVSTPFVLIGRDLDFYTDDVRLERQIRILANMPKVEVVGGAVRNTSGHWRVGCLQQNMRNYALVYQDGYFLSRNECMFCDHLLGPFVTRTKTLKRVPLSSSTPSSTLFENWFIRLGNKDVFVMNCPDVLYFATDPDAEGKANSAEIWLPIARRWALNRLTWPNNPTHVFSCVDANISCAKVTYLAEYFLIPPCCLDEIVKALGFFHQFFTNRSMPYEAFAGICLGAVKMADMIPWDVDADLGFPRENFSLIEKSNELFQEYGYSLGPIHSRSKLVVYTPNMYVELYPFDSFPYEALEPVDFRSMRTKVNIHGIWLNAPNNPGLQARNRYGREMLKHAQSWLFTGKKSSFEPYLAGQFKPCLSRSHHACLDKFPADGGLHFKIT